MLPGKIIGWMVPNRGEAGKEVMVLGMLRDGCFLVFVPELSYPVVISGVISRVGSRGWWLDGQRAPYSFLCCFHRRE